MWTLGDVNRLADATVRERDGHGGYRVEAGGEVEPVEDVYYRARRAMSEKREAERHLEPL